MNNNIITHTFPILLATILIWRGLWNLVDTMVPIETKYDILCVLFGLLIIYRLDAFKSIV